MVNKKLLITLIFTITITQINCIRFKLLSNEPVCLKIPGNNTYIIEYVVSGQNDKNVKMQVFDHQQFITRKQYVNQFNQAFKFLQDVGQVCFTKLDNKQKSISFNYFLETDPVQAIIDKKDIAIAMNSLINAIHSLREVGRNQKFHIQRNQINKTILQQSESKIKWAGIIKIVFLITSALIQLYIMKSFFNRNSVPYQPVEQH